MKYLKGMYPIRIFHMQEAILFAVDSAGRCPVVHLHMPTSDFYQCGTAIGKEKKEANT